MMRARSNIYGKFVSYSKVCFLQLALLFVVETLIILSSNSAISEEIAPKSVVFRFGETSISFERSIVAASSAVRDRLDRLGDPVIEISQDQAVFLRPPIARPSCLEIDKIALTYRMVDPVARLFPSYVPTASKFRGISRLSPPSGRPALDLFQFDADDLKDFWGEHITFHSSSNLPRSDASIQFTRDVHVRVPSPTEGCFFENGEVFIRKLFVFLNAAIKK